MPLTLRSAAAADIESDERLQQNQETGTAGREGHPISVEKLIA